MSLWTSLIKTIAGVNLPDQLDDYVPVRAVPQQRTRYGFSSAVNNNVSADFGAVLRAGSGQSVNQTGGNLVLTAAAAANDGTAVTAGAQISASYHT